jgi:hypothetical protein
MRAGDAIGRAQRGARADGHGLLADVGMERPMNPTILPQLDGEEIELADQDHLAEQVDQFRLSR